METGQGKDVADTCMGVCCACVFGKGCFPPDGHGFDDAACFTLDAVVFVDGVEGVLQTFKGGKKRRGSLGWLHRPTVVWRVCRGADAVVEKVGIECLESVVGTSVGGIEMGERGNDGVADLKLHRGLASFPYI